MYPDILYGGSNYLVAWSDRRSGSYYHIYAARVTPQGAVLDPNGILIGPPGTKYEYQPSVGFDGTQYFIVWGYASLPYAVTGRFVSTGGVPGDTVHIANATGYVYNTRIAYCGTHYFVAWVEYLGTSGSVVKGQIVANDGSLIGSPFLVASDVYYYNCLGLKYDGYNFIVTYSHNPGTTYGIYGRKYDAFGSPVGSQFAISNSAYTCYYGDVIPGGDNYYLNVWAEYRNSTYDIYGNVDIEIVAIEEENKRVIQEPLTIPTVFSGPLHLPSDRQWKVYDINGRERNTQTLAPGVYFLEADGAIIKKVIKVR